MTEKCKTEIVTQEFDYFDERLYQKNAKCANDEVAGKGNLWGSHVLQPFFARVKKRGVGGTTDVCRYWSIRSKDK